MRERRLGLALAAGSSLARPASGVRCFFGPAIAFTAGDMITCNGGAGFAGFNLGTPALYGPPRRRPVCIKVFRDNGEVRYDCLDVAYPGTPVDGGVCFESQDSWDGWEYICQCEGNICQTETQGLDFAEMLASRRRVVITAVSLVCLVLVLLAAGLGVLLWRSRKGRSHRFRTAADLRESEEKRNGGLALVNGRSRTPGREGREAREAREASNGGSRAVTAVSKRATLVQRDSELELVGPLLGSSGGPLLASSGPLLASSATGSVAEALSAGAGRRRAPRGPRPEAMMTRRQRSRPDLLGPRDLSAQPTLPTLPNPACPERAESRDDTGSLSEITL